MNERQNSDQRLSRVPEGKINTGVSRRSFLIRGAAATAVLAPMLRNPVFADEARPHFRRVPVQYIAALADPNATRGDNAQQWGIWRKDPGPRGVPLDYYETLKANANIAPAKWTFNDRNWWLEEHGLIMESPEFPMPAGQYLVTGNREKSAMLTVHSPDADGGQRWELDNDADIYDVTHLRCRSAVYTPADGADSCSPAQAKQSDFPVRPGAAMPPVSGCSKQDYAVLIVYAIAETKD